MLRCPPMPRFHGARGARLSRLRVGGGHSPADAGHARDDSRWGQRRRAYLDPLLEPRSALQLSRRRRCAGCSCSWGCRSTVPRTRRRSRVRPALVTLGATTNHHRPRERGDHDRCDRDARRPSRSDEDPPARAVLHDARALPPRGRPPLPKDLVEQTAWITECRELFGDERASYSDAIDRHYREGAPEGWEASYISEYATMHPWEDFADSFAHYLHITDSLNTAAAGGVVLQARAETCTRSRSPIQCAPSSISFIASCKPSPAETLGTQCSPAYGSTTFATDALFARQQHPRPA